ncbi:MAG: hypothetical protein EPO08_20855 [Rhodospirillaceae bacterium]|nr:MAG: hypothetical protein EPO08_20855 [Rhodospirillaceae bacterium]
MKLLLPQVGDWIDNRKFFEGVYPWGEIYIVSKKLQQTDHKIIQRNGLAFHWPEVEKLNKL